MKIMVDLASLCLNMETAPVDWQMGQHLQMAGKINYSKAI